MQKNYADLCRFIQIYAIGGRIAPPQAASPDPTAENDVLAEKNCTLKRKLRQALTVANSCARAPEDEKGEAGEKIRKLDFALLLE
jgi:hypothetical protein